MRSRRRPNNPFPAPPETIFVYGTLKKEHYNHFWLEMLGAKFLGEGVTVCSFPLIAPRLPTLLPFPGQGLSVHGELYELNPGMITYIDQLEGHPDWYARSKISILSHGSIKEAWVYFITKKSIPPDWETFPILSNF